MKALRYEGGQLAVAEIPKPANGTEATVRVTLSGICNTDVEIMRGYASFQGTLGHEFVGVVEEAPDKALIGRRVVGEINAGCGTCPVCRTGDARHCPFRTVLGIVGRDGAHAEFLQLPAVNLLPVPDEIPDHVAVFAEPLAAAYGIRERVPITSENEIGVIGDGKLGLLCAQALALTGAPVRLIGKHPEKLRIAAERGIKTETVEYARCRTAPIFDTVVEASGSGDGFKMALDLLRPRGTLVLKTTFHGMTQFNMSRIVVNEISIIGSRCGRFAPALDLLKSGAVDVESLISEEYRLTDGVRAMQRATEPGVIKVLLRP